MPRTLALRAIRKIAASNLPKFSYRALASNRSRLARRRSSNTPYYARLIYVFARPAKALLGLARFYYSHFTFASKHPIVTKL